MALFNGFLALIIVVFLGLSPCWPMQNEHHQDFSTDDEAEGTHSLPLQKTEGEASSKTEKTPALVSLQNKIKVTHQLIQQLQKRKEELNIKVEKQGPAVKSTHDLARFNSEITVLISDTNATHIDLKKSVKRVEQELNNTINHTSLIGKLASIALKEGEGEGLTKEQQNKFQEAVEAFNKRSKQLADFSKVEPEIEKTLHQLEEISDCLKQTRNVIACMRVQKYR